MEVEQSSIEVQTNNNDITPNRTTHKAYALLIKEDKIRDGETDNFK